MLARASACQSRPEELIMGSEGMRNSLMLLANDMIVDGCRPMSVFGGCACDAAKRQPPRR